MAPYDAYGNVRGSCGHRHRTVEAAARCAAEDGAAIRRAYPSTFPTRAYSDRSPRDVDTGEWAEIEDEEVA